MSKSGLLARQKAERELWTIKVIAYTEQQTLDAVCLALAVRASVSARSG